MHECIQAILVAYYTIKSLVLVFKKVTIPDTNLNLKFISLCFLCYIYTCICSALFGNLRNFEIALRILSIAKLRANFERGLV